MNIDASGSATVSIPLSTTEPAGTWVLALHDANRKVVAEWKFAVKCDKQKPPAPEPTNSCLTVVSDTSTFVDRGDSVHHIPMASTNKQQ